MHWHNKKHMHNPIQNIIVMTKMWIMDLVFAGSSLVLVVLQGRVVVLEVASTFLAFHGGVVSALCKRCF